MKVVTLLSVSTSPNCSARAPADWWCARKTTPPIFQAARQAGLATGAAFHLVSAHHGDLADSVDGAGGGHIYRGRALDSKRGTVGDRFRSAGWRPEARGSALQREAARRRQVLADDTYARLAGEVHRRIALSDPGIDDYRNELLWSPAAPTLIDAEVQLDKRGRSDGCR